MLIAAQGYGRLCNRLTFFSHLMALSLQYDLKVVNPAFSPYRHSFPGLHTEELASDGIRIRVGTEWRWSVPAVKALSRWRSSDVTLGAVELRFSANRSGGPIVDDDFLEAVKNGIVVLATGWNLTAFDAVAMNAPRIRRAFAPHPGVLSRVGSWLAERNVADSTWVGLHVRRRDYREWESGRFYWSDRQYLELVDRVLDFGDFRIALVTDEPDSIGSSLWRHPAVSISDLSDIEDLTLLAQCDLILGPPSTYSTWASFFGGTPLLHPQSIEQEFDLQDFRVVAPQFVQFGGPLRPLS